MSHPSTPAYQNATPKKNIFLSYRKRDTESVTGRVFDTLKTHFSDEQIFMDIDKLEPGVDFEEVITKRLDDCDVMLAIIGPEWLGRKADGSTRIMEEKDWVRLELATALKRRIRVIPVLVEGATLPTKEQLPQELQSLTGKQVYELSNHRWSYDPSQLFLFLKKLIGEETPLASTTTENAKLPSRSKKLAWILCTIGLVAVAAVLYLLTKKGPREAGPSLDNVEGTWQSTMDDTSRSYYITQNKKQLVVKEYVGDDEQYAGGGEIEGKNVTFSFSLPDGTEKLIKAIYSEDSTYYYLTGSVTTSKNDSVTTNPVHLKYRFEQQEPVAEDSSGTN